LVEAYSYPATWTLKPLPEAPKPPPSSSAPSGVDAAAVPGTAAPGTAAGGTSDNGAPIVEVGTDPYALNKANVGKPGFAEEGEMIIGHKFKYFKKGDKKGQIHSGQLFVATRP
jgi:hypothetical protein